MKNVKNKKNKFNQLSKSFQTVIKKSVTTAALLVHGDATRLAPVDTGRLRSSLTYITQDNAAIVGTDVEYAKKMEYGGSKQAPNGYLRPALYNNIDKINAIFTKQLKGLEKHD